MNRKVLIIDDEKDECLLLSRLLMRRNFEVDSAYSLEEGMQKLAEGHPDILFLDDNLPDGLGWSKAHAIQMAYPSLIITLISAHEASPFAVTANGAGFAQLEKPICLQKLNQFIGQ